MSDLKEIPYWLALSTYLGWTVLFVVGHILDFFAALFWKPVDCKPGYAPLRQDYEDFYIRRAYYRLVDCFSRPVVGPPDRVMNVALRTPPRGNHALVETGEIRSCINLGSYNYLGFASEDPFCTPRCIGTLEDLAASTCSSRLDAGTTRVHLELERAVASFLGQEDAIVLGMGYATNSAIIPALVGKGDLIISDALNHTSIVNGVRGSAAVVKVFRHNDCKHLEAVLRLAIGDGQPRTHRPWHRILIIVEGIYSMEGEISDLRGIIALKKKYKAYLFLDEAHSIGALGATGRGSCEYAGVGHSDIDVLMGTFTKSFGSCGGYVAGSKALVAHIRNHSPAHNMATSISPVAAQQILSSMTLIMTGCDGRRGPEKVLRLRENSNYFRWRLLEMGFQCLGDWDSPVIPIMVYRPAALTHFSRLCLERHVAVVVVGFPATSLLTARVRICVSACHRRADLDYSLRVLEYAGMMTGCLINRSVPKSLPSLESLLRHAHDVNSNLIAA